MPSVELLRLRRQAVELAEFFPQAEAFARRLDLLLESYSAAPSRKGEIKGARPVLSSYGAPALVLKQVLLECTPLAQDEPDLALDVVDQLWPRRKMEPRQLAARLLGVTPAEAAPITQRIQDWNRDNREIPLLLELGQAATLHLREQQPAALLDFVGELFTEDNWRQAALGLIALQALLEERAYPDLPTVYKLLDGFHPDPPRRLRAYWLDVYRSLAAQSPKETLYHLQQRLAAAPESGLPWLARNLLEALPAEQRQALRAALKA